MPRRALWTTPSMVFVAKPSRRSRPWRSTRCFEVTSSSRTPPRTGTTLSRGATPYPIRQEPLQRVDRLVRLLFEDPMTGVRQDDGRGVGRHELHLLRQQLAVRLRPADGEDRHRELRLRELGELLRRLLERHEVRPAGPHPAGPRIR